MGTLAGGWGCVCSWVTDLILSLPCLVLDGLKLVSVLSPSVPFPGHTELPSGAGTSNAGFWKQMSQRLCLLAGSWLPCRDWWARTTQHSSVVPVPAGNVHSWHQIPGLVSVTELKAWWWGGRIRFSTRCRSQGRVRFPRGSLSPGSEESEGVSCQKSRHCVSSKLAAFSPPEAWRCLGNTLVRHVDDNISLLLLVWHARLVEYFLSKLLPPWNFLFL